MKNRYIAMSIIILAMIISFHHANAAELPGMVFVKGGCFQMGSKDGDKNEVPVHKVCLDNFYMDRYEVTVGTFEKGSAIEPECPECAMEFVTWDAANIFCQKAGKRLPTEAEWEYAARSGGKDEKWAGTSNENRAWEYVVYRANANVIHPVGDLRPNGLGLYDMSGNAFEWVADWYDAEYYGKSPELNPKGPASGQAKVYRGGGEGYPLKASRTQARYNEKPQSASAGFRCAQSAGAQSK